jgi:hypothetical protein
VEILSGLYGREQTVLAVTRRLFVREHPHIFYASVKQDGTQHPHCRPLPAYWGERYADPSETLYRLLEKAQVVECEGYNTISVRAFLVC